MTLINSWSTDGGVPHQGAQRTVYLHCDGCLPPEFFVGPPAQVAENGWSFDDLDRGPHRCPWCAGWTPGRERRRPTEPEACAGLPNLLVIGASKCGTTSLHHYLSLHPEIHMSRTKELRFFEDPGCLERLSTYATFFDGAAPVRGESSPRYALHPIALGVPERIRAAIPDVKLIYLVRDPVDRAVSQYVDWRSRRWRGDVITFEQALGDIDDPYNEYVAGGRYATQLERYLEVFPAERILVVDHGELLHERDRTLREVFRFLGVDERFTSPGFARALNPGGEKRTPTGAYGSVSRSRIVRAARRRVPPGVRRVARAPLRRWTSRRVEAPTVTPELEARLRAVFADEIRRLEKITGGEFRSWATRDRSEPEAEVPSR